MLENEKKQLGTLLDELIKAVEELLLAGMTAASKSTVERLDISFKEASRMKLLRLGSTLRIANEEITRFTGNAATPFSSRRLSFFLSRAWLLASAMRRAIDADDQEALNRLQVTPAVQPIEALSFVTLGVAKRIVPGAFASFDFRLRALGAAGPVADRESLIWSCVFPLRRDLDLPAEAFLHLPQKQKFKPIGLLEKKVVSATKCAVSGQAGVVKRLTLSESSIVTVGERFEDWGGLWDWNLHAAAERLEQHRPTPMDLEIEFQEEVFLSGWSAGETQSTEDTYDLMPIATACLPFSVRLDRGPSGRPLNEVLGKLANESARPPIYGITHYESCQMVLQPLSVLGTDGIDYLTVLREGISQADLVKAMKFT